MCKPVGTNELFVYQRIFMVSNKTDARVVNVHDTVVYDGTGTGNVKHLKKQLVSCQIFVLLDNWTFRGCFTFKTTGFLLDSLYNRMHLLSLYKQKWFFFLFFVEVS